MSESEVIKAEISQTTQAMEDKVQALEDKVLDKVSFFAVGACLGIGLWVGRRWTLSGPREVLVKSSVTDEMKKTLALGALVAIATEVGKRQFPEAKERLSGIQSAALTKIAGAIGSALLP